MRKTEALKYKVLVEEEGLRGKKVFVVYVPKLGISDFGDTIESALANTKEAVECYLEALEKQNQEIPVSDGGRISFFSEIPVEVNSKFALS